MKIKVEVHVLGSDSIIETYRSDTIEGKEAEAIREVVNTTDETSILSFPEISGMEVFFNRAVLDRCVVLCSVWDEEEDETA